MGLRSEVYNKVSVLAAPVSIIVREASALLAVLGLIPNARAYPIPPENRKANPSALSLRVN